MSSHRSLVLDDGYRFGLGAFETILIVNKKGVLLPYHLQRLKEALSILNIPFPSFLEEEIRHFISFMSPEQDVLRVSVSQNNLIHETRKNNYTRKQYAQGFSLTYSTVRRNETSPFSRIKSLNQGDNILQKRLALAKGFDEAVFLNSKGELTEGSTSNLFFVAAEKIYTPALECGLLPGTVRHWLMENRQIEEVQILPADITYFEEAFVTNSLLGIMPIKRLDDFVFLKRRQTEDLMKLYQNMIEKETKGN